MKCVLMPRCPDTFLVLCPQQQRDDALTSYMQLLARSIPASTSLLSYLPTYTFLPSRRTRQLISPHQPWQTRVAIRATLALKTAQQPPLQLLDDHFLLNHHPGRLFLPTHIPAIKLQHHPPQLL